MIFSESFENTENLQSPQVYIRDNSVVYFSLISHNSDLFKDTELSFI